MRTMILERQTEEKAREALRNVLREKKTLLIDVRCGRLCSAIDYRIGLEQGQSVLLRLFVQDTNKAEEVRRIGKNLLDSCTR